MPAVDIDHFANTRECHTSGTFTWLIEWTYLVGVDYCGTAPARTVEDLAEQQGQFNLSAATDYVDIDTGEDN